MAAGAQSTPSVEVLCESLRGVVAQRDRPAVRGGLVRPRGVRHGSASTRQAISQHLDVLEAAGLVKTRREGRYKFHDLDTAPLQEITARWPKNRRRRPE
jgi:DNA-binding transcriptional ArsR family regulator